MRKILSKIAGLALGLSLAAGVGVSLRAKQDVAEPVEAASATYEVTVNNLTGWNSTQGSQTGTSGVFTLESNNGANNTQIRLYSGGTHTFTCSGGNITKAVFTCTANGTSNYGPGKLSGNGYTAGTGKTGTWEGNATSFTLTGGQARVTSIVFTYESSTPVKTLDSIAVSGTLSKKSYTTAEDWSFAGLTVTGTYSDASHDDLTSSASFKVYDSTGATEKARPYDLGAGSHSIPVMATVNSLNSPKVTISGISIEEVTYTNSTSLVPGSYYIKYDTHYFTGSISSGKGSSSTNQPGSAGEFTFTLVGNDLWEAVNGDGKYLGIGTTSTSLSLNNSSTTLIIEDGVEGGDGVSFKIKGSSGRYMAWYSTNSDFRTYTSGDIVLTFESTSTVSYTITYNANAADAEGGMSPSTGSAPQVAACTFTRDGYSFLRWNTQPDGEGEDYAVGATVAADITLYVIWQEYIAPIGGNVTMSGEENASSATVNTHSAIKCGTGSKAGKMSLTLGLANMTKIKVYVAGWKDEDKTVGVTISSGTISPTTLNLSADSGIQGSGTDFTLSNSESTYKFEFTISGGVPANTVITLTAGVASSNRFVVWGATDLFAESFADEFSSNLTCDASGEDGPSFTSGHSWTTMNSFYNGLDAEEQGRLRDATFTVSGSGSSTVVTATGDTVQSVAEAMARYDYILAKYGTSEYANFIGRTVTKMAPARMIGETISSSSSTIIIVVVALTSITSIGVLLVIKRRRSLVK